MKSDSTPANTACKADAGQTLTIAGTCRQLIDERIPNLFRLYLNPFVAEACYCLSAYVRSTWPAVAGDPWDWPSYLANGRDEALSGAVKLARYASNQAARSPAALVLDPCGDLENFGSVPCGSGSRRQLVPLLEVASGEAAIRRELASPEARGVLVVQADGVGAPAPDLAAGISEYVRHHKPLLILCVSRLCLAACCAEPTGWLAAMHPDIVVFDETFGGREVPFGAFTARRDLYERWLRGKKSTFHSTTYQPNSISSLQFMRCLARDDAALYASVAEQLEKIRREPKYRRQVFQRLYSPSLTRLISTLGFDRVTLKTDGHYVLAGEKRIFDGVGGVACSIRGHNPPQYLDEVHSLAGVDCRAAVAERLEALTGIRHSLPAVSGASAVEVALKLGLASQPDKPYVLALRGGFGGKTLVSLTGTSNPALKTHLDPLYEHAIYVDPFGSDVISELREALARYPVGVVQLELIQGVGGVREIPRPVIQWLDEQRNRAGYWLFIDEVQTGVYRTGPFLRSMELGLRPDLLTMGKGISDMMFPFAFTLYSQALHQRLAPHACSLPEYVRDKFGYEMGFRTALNVLDRADELQLAQRVAEASARLRDRLARRASECRMIQDVRIYGLLIGIELNVSQYSSSLLRRLIPRLSLLAMLRHRAFPLLVGFCQYEPHVLKFTPPLTITSDEIDQVCDTLFTVLDRSAPKLVATGAATMAVSTLRRLGAVLQ